MDQSRRYRGINAARETKHDLVILYFISDLLAALFDKDAVFVHMGGTMSRNQELDVIRSGAIQYKSAEIQEASVRFVGNTAVLLNRIRLVAVVGGNEVINPFVVTEVYVHQGGAWTLASLSFTRLLTPP